MKAISLMVLTVSCCMAVYGQHTSPEPGGLPRPKLVVGIVVDQMRWDYLYRYYNKYGSGGFKRLLNEGFSCENTFINCLPSYTAVGHTCIFTGSVPSLSGITSNNWIEQLSGRRVYCTDDSSVQGVGAHSDEGKMSPRNLLVTTVTDELRMASNYQSKVVGISLKDRASILPAGHSPTGAFWLDDGSANFITSTYYMQELPAWVTRFNEQKRILQLLKNDWNPLYSLAYYKESDGDDKSYEGKFKNETSPVFPHRVNEAYVANPANFRYTPFGNTLTLDFATAAVEGYRLGRGPATDFLTINCASTDYVGHLFGPNSIEVEDTYLRLDKDLAAFFSMLDATIGKNQYLIFLTADHGAAHAVGYLQEHSMPSGFFISDEIIKNLNQLMEHQFGVEKLIRSGENYQINLDLDKINAYHLAIDSIKNGIIDYLIRQPGITYAVDQEKAASASIPEPLKTMIINGYNFKRSGQVEVIFDAGWLENSSKTGTTHGAWNPYDTHIPLLFMGWGIRSGHSNVTYHMTDIAPTIAAMLHIQMPSGCIGTPIQEVIK